MKLHLARTSPLAVCCAMAATLAVAFGIWGYLVPVDSGNVGMFFVFIMSPGVLLLGLGAFVAISDRWSWRT
ncbi:MAG: hypothetical protein IT536_18555 [Hyphomicrobiales bacterium]|nr:hypothetical protein [Hyphomicrobiales bacterium]